MGYDGGMIRVNFTSVAAAADSIERIQKTIDGQLDQLRSYCNSATSQWTGNARDAYTRLQADWDNTAAELNTNLREIANGVRTSHGNFSQAETRNTQTWAG
jgi:WXG100 family type VII secretion target